MSAPSTPGCPVAAVPIIQVPQTEPQGLIEMWIEDPDGIPLIFRGSGWTPSAPGPAIGVAAKMTTGMRHESELLQKSSDRLLMSAYP
jgi:hypothetical protein